MNTSESLSSRSVWLFVFVRLSAVALFVGAGCYLIDRTAERRGIDTAYLAAASPVLIALGIASLLGALATIFLLMDGNMGENGRDFSLSLQQFEDASLQALVLSNVCVVMGFIIFLLGAPLREYAYFAVGTLLINFAFILPRSLRFWSACESGLVPQRPRSPFDAP